MIGFRATTPRDQPALENLLHTVWEGDIGATAYHGRGRRPGRLAEVDGEPVGYGMTWRSALHPTYTSIGVHVHPACRGRGIGSRLWQAVTAGVSGPLKSATSSSQLAALRFLERRGLRVTAETHEPVLRLSDLLPQRVEKWIQKAQELGFELLPMTDLPEADLLLLHRDVYAHTHEHDPPKVDLLDADDVLGDDLVTQWLFVARKGGVLAGVSSVRLDSPSPMLGWFGVTRAWAGVGRELTLALTGQAVQAAAWGGVTELTAELDSPDPNALHLLRELPWQPGRVWLTLTESVERSEQEESKC